MDTPSMIERVARAIAKGEYGENVDDVWHTCIDDARAAIEAMREPTEAMLDAGYGAEPTGAALVAPWEAMIDAALAEQS